MRIIFFALSKVVPSRGEVVVFNRSHYEDVLAVKVHPEYMEQLPAELSVTKNKKILAGSAMRILMLFERHLARSGIVVLKFFCISPKMNKNRLLERLTIEDKYWKVSQPILKSVNSGMTTLALMKICFPKLGMNMHRGLWYLLTIKKIARAIVHT